LRSPSGLSCRFAGSGYKHETEKTSVATKFKRRNWAISLKMTTSDLTEILEAIEIADTIPNAFGRVQALIELSCRFGVDLHHIVRIRYLYLTEGKC
jgi:hypothetical protein